MATREPVKQNVRDELLVRCRRRCCLCFFDKGELEPKLLQLAHIDRNSANSDEKNLACLCTPCHEEYDAKHNNVFGYTPEYLRRAKEALEKYIAEDPRWAHHETYEIVVSGDDEDISVDQIRETIKVLKLLTADQSIRIVGRGKGSVRLVFEGSKNGLNQLLRLHETQQLSREIALDVEEVKRTTELEYLESVENFSALEIDFIGRVVRNASRIVRKNKIHATVGRPEASSTEIHVAAFSFNPPAFEGAIIASSDDSNSGFRGIVYDTSNEPFDAFAQSIVDIISEFLQRVGAHFDYLLLNEGSLSFDTQTRKSMLLSLQHLANRYDTVIVPGSYTDPDRFDEVAPLIIPGAENLDLNTFKQNSDVWCGEHLRTPTQRSFNVFKTQSGTLNVVFGQDLLDANIILAIARSNLESRRMHSGDFIDVILVPSRLRSEFQRKKEMVQLLSLATQSFVIMANSFPGLPAHPSRWDTCAFIGGRELTPQLLDSFRHSQSDSANIEYIQASYSVDRKDIEFPRMGDQLGGYNLSSGFKSIVTGVHNYSRGIE